MIATLGFSYKGYRIDYYANTGCWSITKIVDVNAFEKVDYVATLYSRSDCIEFIDKLCTCRK